MTPEVIIAGAVGAALAALGGYLVGARMGAGARERLRDDLRHKEEDVRRVRLELSGVLKAEKQAMARPPTPAPAPAVPPEATIGLLTEVRDLVGPLAEVARLKAALTNLSGDFEHRGHLELLLEAVAEQASLSSVVLSDEAGLPLAAARAHAGDAMAAAASLVLTLTDRLEATGEPAAVGAAVHDAQGRRVLHRIFPVGAERYVLTAVAQGVDLGPEALDPIIPLVRRLLRQPGPLVEVA